MSLLWEPMQADPADDRPRDPLSRLTARMFFRDSYLRLHADLASVAEGNPDFDAEGHFSSFGMAEGRAPSILFDIGYAQHWLAKMGETDVPHTEVFAHFARLSTAARFVPNRWFSPRAFRALYKDRYAELADMSDYTLFEFYLDKVAHAALSPNGVFNEERYRLNNPDVAVAIGQGVFSSGFMHFATCGRHEGRGFLPGADFPRPPGDAALGAEADWMLGGQAGLDRIAWWFDEAFYLTIYPDVHDLVRRSLLKSGLEHYLVHGFPEGRIPSPGFLPHMPSDSSVGAWEHFAALAMAGVEPRQAIPMAEACQLLRYLDRPGWSGNRRAATDALWPIIAPPHVGGTFDAQRYLAVNVDVAASIGGDPKAAEDHWREFGIKEHRSAIGTNLFGDRTVSFRDMLAWRSGVNFFGPVSASSGLGHAARGYVAALKAAGVPIDVYDTSILINPQFAGDLFCDEELSYSINFLCINADQVTAFAFRWGTRLFERRANVAAWVWELPFPRAEWRGGLSAFDLILTPSRFCTNSFSVFTDLPVRTVPYVVDAAALEAARDAYVGNSSVARIEAEKAAGKRIILFVMDASSYSARKGVDLYCALAARVSAARPGQYLFVLKAHSRDISLAHAEPYGDDVLAIDGLFSFSDLCRLKSIADLYVSPHRSEGFGLNIIESILLGVPVLCSDAAGSTDLLDGNQPPLIPVRQREIGREMGPYRAEAIWYEPDLDAMEAHLLAFFDTPPDSGAFEALRARLREALSVERVGELLRRELTDHCALGAETSQNSLEAFGPIATRRAAECYTLGCVEEHNRRSPHAPGLGRLGEIAMEAPRPRFSVITPTYNTSPEWLEDIYNDLLNQSYPSWEWCIADDGSTNLQTIDALRALRRRDARIKLRLGETNRGISAATNAAVAISQGTYILMVDHDDRLSPDLLATYYGATQQPVPPGVIYCDEDKIDPSGIHCETYFKPDWSPEHALSCMYVLHCLCVRKSLFLELGGYRTEFDGAQDHDFLLRAAAAHAPIRHVDALLYHWRIVPSSTAGRTSAKEFAVDIGRRAVADHCRMRGIAADVEHGIIPGTYRVRPHLPKAPVELNILTGCTPRRAGDGSRHASAARPPWFDPDAPEDEAATYVEHFVRSILAYAPHQDFVIRVVVDVGAEAVAGPLALLDPRVRIVPFQRAGGFFNFAEKANFAVRSGTADRIVLLNDDMEALDPDWLPALLEPLELPGVGVVGGRMLYGDDTVQHSGIVMGVHGAAAHLFEGVPVDLVCYNAYNQVIRNYSAVSGAMFAFSRATFERVRGFDEQFPIDYNDVDFCLRAGEAGLRTVFTPFARLRHFESRSARRLVPDALDRQRFCKRWAAAIARDPYYNRNLTRSGVLCEAA